MGVDLVSNSNKTVDIFYDPDRLGSGELNAGYHVRKKGESGFPLVLGDCSFNTKNDALVTAKEFLDKGYPIENIRINGQPVTDKFQKNKDGKYEPVVRHEGDTFEKKPSTMKKVGRGAASAVIPGAGQILNGDYKKAGWIIAGNILLPKDSIYRDVLQGYSVYDAYKNTPPSKIKQPKATEQVKEKA